jgi:hypothetical protein
MEICLVSGKNVTQAGVGTFSARPGHRLKAHLDKGEAYWS